MNRLVVVVLLAGLLGSIRMLLPVIPLDNSPMSLFKDFSHIFCGVLLGGALFTDTPKWRVSLLVMFFGLAVVEAVVVLHYMGVLP